MADIIRKKDISVKDPAGDYIKSLEKASEVTDKLEKEIVSLLKTQKKLIDQNKKPTNVKQVKELNKAIKKTDDTVKTLNNTRKVSIQIDKEKEKALLKIKKLNSDRIQDVVQLNRLAKEQNAINKDTEIVNNKKVGTLTKLAAQNRILIREQKGLNLELKKDRERLKVINKELDKNTAFIKKNSSALQKQKINVGNYTNSIKDAAQASGLFGGILGKLNAVQETLNALTKKNVVAEEADILAKEGQVAATSQLTLAQRTLNRAQAGGVKALKALKAAFVATGIGAVVVALGALFTLFTRSQDAVDSLSDQMARFTATLDVLIDRFSLVGRGIVQIFQGLGNELKQAQIRLKIFLLEATQFNAFGKVINDNTEEINELNSELDDLVGIEKGLETIRSAIKNIGDEIERDGEAAKVLNALTREATREAKLFEAQQSAALTTIKELNLISRDKLRTDQERIDALTEANEIEVALSERQLEIQAKLLASSLDAFDAETEGLKLDKERLDFVDRIRNGQIEVAEAVQLAADFTLSSAKGADALNDIIEKIVAQEQARQSLLDKQATTIKKLSALQVQVATKNAQALVREATALRQVAKDQEETLERRIDLLTQAAAKEIESFRIQKDANIKNEQELAAARLQINAKLQADIQKLLPDSEAIARKQVAEVNKIEQELLAQQIKGLERRLENEELNAEQRIELITEIAEIERTKAQAQAEFLMSLEGKTAEEIEFIRLQLSGKLDDIRNAEVDAVKSTNEEILESEKDLQAEREALQDARINSAKNVAEILSGIASEDENTQRNLERLKKTLAITEIIINSNREVAAIRAEVKDNEALKRSRVIEARTSAAASIAGVLSAFDGVDDTGGRGDVDSRGGKHWVLHPHEQVDSLADRKKKADPRTGKLRTRDEITSLVNFADSVLMSPHAFKSLEMGNVVSPNDINIKEIIRNNNMNADRTIETLKRNKTSLNFGFDNAGNFMKRIEDGAITKITTFKQDKGFL